MTNNIQEVLNLEGRIVARKERQLIHLLSEAEKRVQYDADYYAKKGKHRSSWLNISQYRIWGIAPHSLTGEKQEFPIIPFFTDIKTRLSKRRSTPCMISLWNIYGDASYNRSEEINWAQIDESISYEKGFDIKSEDTSTYYMMQQMTDSLLQKVSTE